MRVPYGGGGAASATEGARSVNYGVHVMLLTELKNIARPVSVPPPPPACRDSVLPNGSSFFYAGGRFRTHVSPPGAHGCPDPKTCPVSSTGVRFRAFPHTHQIRALVRPDNPVGGDCVARERWVRPVRSLSRSAAVLYGTKEKDRQCPSGQPGTLRSPALSFCTSQAVQIP